MIFKPTHIVIHSTMGKDRPDAYDMDGLDDYMHLHGTHYDKVCEMAGQVRLFDMHPVTEIGAHCRGWNGNPGSRGRAIGYAFIGDGRVQAPPDVALAFVARFILADMLAWGIPIERVLMHKDMPGANTDCPGAAFVAAFPRLLDAIRRAG